ncbi:hypothetical protein GWI33_018860 [Rhynchophorus ferrugineus]|uniref:Uncharacterized protein n=1 Tax=Rhynchophorus ferrugineus TaxID=354439 RepID=A0A834M5W4_RHYFE|nr:hypothetical protein GWI33_018860 [Rhynchophorus ferrugineus]
MLEMNDDGGMKTMGFISNHKIDYDDSITGTRNSHSMWCDAIGRIINTGGQSLIIIEMKTLSQGILGFQYLRVFLYLG